MYQLLSFLSGCSFLCIAPLEQLGDALLVRRIRESPQQPRIFFSFSGLPSFPVNEFYIAAGVLSAASLRPLPEARILGAFVVAGLKRLAVKKKRHLLALTATAINRKIQAGVQPPEAPPQFYL